MHELTIIKCMLEAAETEARRHGAARITRIDCRIGRLRQIDRELLEEAFAVACVGKPAEGAVLQVIQVGIELHCHRCGCQTELEDWCFECPACGSPDIRLSGGEELELTSIGLEVPDDDRGPEEEHLCEKRLRRGRESAPA